MKRVFFLILCAFSLQVGIYAQSAKEKADAEAAVRQLFEGISALDMNVIRQTTTADILLIEDGVLWNMDSIVNIVNMFKGVEFSRKNQLDFISTEVRGNTAWVAYSNAADMAINGQPMNLRWMESAVLVKQSGRWRVRMLHSTTRKTEN